MTSSTAGRLGWLAALLVPALVLPACGHPVQRQLAGTWRGESVENFDDRDIPRATGWAKSLRFTFQGATIAVSIAAEEERFGSYRVKSVHKSDVLLAVQRPDGTEDLAAFKLDGDHSMRWMLPSSRAIVLQREL